MVERERRIQLWFEMWLKQKDLGIENLFADNAVYIESWRPKYESMEAIKQWFEEWNTRGKVVVWEIKQFFHKDNQTIVEWHFKNKMNNGISEEFDGISLVAWTNDNKIKFIKEFGCNIDNYNPYQDSENPHFREKQINWF